METLMDIAVTVRSTAIVLLVVVFSLAVWLGAILAVDELYEATMKYPRKFAAHAEKNRARWVKEQEALADQEVDYWKQFKDASGFHNTGEIVNRYYHNWDEDFVDGPGSNR